MSGPLVLYGAVALGLAANPVPVPGQPALETVDFERHVMGLFSKAGCNNGSCHGSFQGKGGFRLSLFGYDPDKDFTAVTRDGFGRRVNEIDPDRSLLLLKATAQTPHEGGLRFARDSWQYRVLRTWIAAGAPWRAGSGTVTDLILDQPEYVFVAPGATTPLAVKARYADGTEESVTAFCDFRIADDAVAEVSPLGVVKASRPGDTGLTVSYRGTVRAVRVLVPTPVPAGFQYPDVPTAGFIDREVVAKLKRLNVVPSDPASDAEFLRRVTIDTIGSLPTPDAVRAFLADPAPDKRTRKIDELLAHPLHAALWATKLSDVTGNNTDSLENPVQLKAKRSQQWHDWLRKRIAENVPYDEIVRGILTATSREGMAVEEWVDLIVKQDEAIDKGFDESYKDRQTLDLFWRRQQQVPIEQWGEKVAAAFLGIRLECAQCHKHPTDRWTQTDYRAFANLFGQVVSGPPSPETRRLVEEVNAKRRDANTGNNNNRLNLIRETYIALPPPPTPVRPANPKAKAKAVPKAAAKAAPKAFNHPETNRPLPAKALGGPELPIAPGVDVRPALFEWMRSPDNAYFARSFVNRVWAHYFGIGLVDPVDDFSVANPPTNARLLDALARDFVEHQFDLRYLERLILTSHSYQRSSTPNATNRFDKNNFARGYVRPMLAEVVVDVLNAALGTDETFGNDGRAGAKMIEVGASRLANPNLAYALRIFGRPPRTTACDCERALDPALPQTLYRMTDPAILQKLAARDGRLQTLLRDRDKTDDEVFAELVLATLTRPPTDTERAAFAEFRDRESNRQVAFTDALWGAH